MTAPDLSEREFLILRRVAAGHAFKHIARDLGVVDSAVAMAVYQMRAKFGATNTAHLIALAYRTRVLTVPPLPTSQEA